MKGIVLAGGAGGGDDDSKMVYCFLQNSYTRR